MGPRSASKLLGTTASVIIIIQGLVWICLTLMAILVHLEGWKPELFTETYGQQLSSTIVVKYLQRNTSTDSVILGSNEFFYCNIVHLILSGCWLAVASFQLWATSQENLETLKYAYLTFGVGILIGCIYDVILTTLFAIDYDTIVGKINSTGEWSVERTFLVLACGILMTIAARGFILWIINLTVAILLIKSSLDISIKVADDFSLINAFATPSTPVEATNNNTNLPTDMFENFHGLPRLPPIQSTKDRLNKLNKIKVSPVAVPNKSHLHTNKSSYASDSSSVNSSIRKPRFQTADSKNRHQQY